MRQVAELLADPAGVGVVKLIEDVQGLLPGVACGVGMTRGVMSVADVDERGRFGPAVPEVAEHGERLFVAAGGAGVLAELVVGVAEAVPGVRLAGPVAKLLLQGEGWR
jgi:hypothetical protein